jgi:serine/threonine protein kinase
MWYTDKNRHKNYQLTREIHKGGEGSIWEVQGHPYLVAKIYHEDKRSETRFRKLQIMIAHPPHNPTQHLNHPSFVWPTEILYHPQARQPVGYLMPKIQNMHPIIYAFTPKSRQKIAAFKNFHYKHLVRIAHNIAATLAELHRANYVVGDINELNILVNEKALVTFVDTDSFQVIDPNTQEVHPCPVGRLEYTPPEIHKLLAQGKKFEDFLQEPHHDDFGLAVIVFRLLMEGAFPFADTSGRGNPMQQVELIMKGIFPYDPIVQTKLRLKAPAHAPPYEMLSIELQNLFKQAFVDSLANERIRPKAEDFTKALEAYENSLKPCAQSPCHWYPQHLSQCPWCAREVLLGYDPFPCPQTRVKQQPAHSARRHPAPSQKPLPPSSPIPPVSFPPQAPTPTPPLSSPSSPTPPAPFPSRAPTPAPSRSYSSRPTSPPSIPRKAPSFPRVSLPSPLILGLALVAFIGIVAWIFWPSKSYELLFEDLRGCKPIALHTASEGRFIAICAEGSIAQGHLEDNQLSIEDLPQGKGAISAVSLSPDGRYLAVATTSEPPRSKIQVYLAKSHRTPIFEAQTSSPISHLAFSQTATYLAAIESHALSIWSVSTHKSFHAPRSEGSVIGLGFVGPSEILVAYEKGLLEKWKMEGSQIVKVATYTLTTSIRHVEFSPHGHKIGVIGTDDVIYLLDADLRLLQMLDPPLEGHEKIKSLAFSPDERWIAAASSRGKVWLWRRNHAEPEITEHFIHTAIQALAFLPDGQSLLIGTRQGEIYLWHFRQD